VAVINQLPYQWALDMSALLMLINVLLLSKLPCYSVKTDRLVLKTCDMQSLVQTHMTNCMY